MQAGELQIEPLANHPEYLVPLSNWYHHAFSHLTGDLTIEQRRQNLMAHLNNQTLPVSFVAIENKHLRGGLCLVEHDIESHRSLTPWLSRIYVHERSRGRSIARLLIDHGVDHIQTLGYRNLYLITEHKQAFFSGVGFEEIDRACLNGFALSIMVLNIT